MKMSQLSEKQLSALELVLSGHNLLILGSAGTGKSFLVREIVEKCTAKGKRVFLTCTTGIACSIYEAPIKAQTIHQWSGINDGRYSPAEIKCVIKNTPNYTNILNRLMNTDLLIIDECSMLSKRMFNCLSEVCSLKNESMLFGGIQLVLCGDFHQLPPVPNALCNEQGDYCFESELFSTVLTHKLTLTDVFRQNEDVLIKAIQEVASGYLSSGTFDFINTLNRPLPDVNSIKLFATNEHVDDFNRDSVLDFPGPVFEFVSNDTGEKRYLTHILAPHILWLKIGAPVILLRNMSDKLVNGLCGQVYDVQDSTVVVEFPTLDLKVPLQKVKFSVFSRMENKDIAVREQLPLKLAFALTIHKSQGMTLDSVEVDCRGIFKPGQLGVAMGRAKSTAGLRILNFNTRACMPHPESVKTFLAQPSGDPVEDKSCCQITRSLKENPSFFRVQETLSLGIDKDIDFDGELEFDDEFDEIIKTIDAKESDIELPLDLNLTAIFEKLKFSNPVTTFQCNTNYILDNLDRYRLKKFCQKEYKHISSLTDKIKFKGAVKCRDLGNFYTAVHEYHTSAEFLLKCMMMFEGECFTAEHKHICFNISVELRKFILSKHAEVYPSTVIKLTERSVTNASRARIRYVAGYCIAKVRSKFINKKDALRYAKTAENQQAYKEAVYTTRLLNSLREDEQYILSNSIEPESLLDVTRRQNVNRGLTNISDETFTFFIKLSNLSLSLLSDKTFHKYGNEMFEACKQKIIENEEIYDSFSSLLKNHADKYCDFSRKETNIDEPNVVKTLFQKILKLFLLVLFAQFRKDILDIFKVSKKMAHRKQIQVSNAGSKTTKKGRHDGDDALNSSKKVKRKKITPSSTTQSASPLTEQDPLPEHHTDLEYVAETSAATGSSPLPCTSQANLPQAQASDSPIQGTSQSQDEDENELCKICWTADRETQWIQCSNCSGWLHRKCAGLKHHMKWKKYQKAGSIFYCRECE